MSAPASRGGLRLLGTGAAARDGWREITASDPTLPVCHLPEWMDSMREAGAFEDASRLYRADDGRLVLLLLARHRRLPSPFRLYDSWPGYWEGARDSGGIIGTGGIVTPDDVRSVVADLRRLHALRIQVVPSTADAAAWVAGAPRDVTRSTRRAYVVDLSGGFATVLAERVSGKTRYKTRRADRAGITVEDDATGRLLPDFDALYRRSVAAWSQQHFLPTPVARRVIERRHSHAKLQVVARRLGDRCRVWIARRDGVPVSGIVVLSHGSAATYWKGATDKALVGATGATDLLHVRAMERACAEGRSRYDLGTSGLASLTEFKLSLGAQPVDFDVYHLEALPVTPFQEALRGGLKRAFRARRG